MIRLSIILQGNIIRRAIHSHRPTARIISHRIQRSPMISCSNMRASAKCYYGSRQMIRADLSGPAVTLFNHDLQVHSLGQYLGGACKKSHLKIGFPMEFGSGFARTRTLLACPGFVRYLTRHVIQLGQGCLDTSKLYRFPLVLAMQSQIPLFQKVNQSPDLTRIYETWYHASGKTRIH